jgi:hypothetical protein
MSNGETDTDDRERAALLSEIDLLQGELRRHLLMLVEHPGVTEEFKINSVVKEWVK